MKTIKTMKYIALMMIALCAFSCDGEDGNDGMDGMDGTNGTQGIAGEDGNANVIGRTIDPFPAWEAGFYLGVAANTVELIEPLLDAATTENSLVLVYFQVFGQDVWYPMTLAIPLSGGNSQVVTYTYALNRIDIYALDNNGELNAGLSKVRYFIIPANDNGRSSNGIENVQLQLEQDGVDISSYEEVAAYFDL